jgi:hypothetical protein
MIYGIAHRSREADVVIWDAQAFPSLPMLDHSFFFAESVRAVIESKSRWSDQDFHDVLKKSRAIRDIIPMYRPSLAGDVEMLQLEIEALKRGVQHDGMLHVEPHIGTGAIFLRGGATGLAAKASDPDLIEDADDSWPDLVLLVEPGHLVVKDYTDGVGHLLYYELGEDALLAFTNGLLVLLNDRSVHLREPLYLSQYAWDVAGIAPVRIARFPITRPTPMRVPLWR